MQYPSDWKKVLDETSGILELGVQFISPQISPNVRKAEVVLKVEDLSNSAIQPELTDIVKNQTSYDEGHYLDYHLIESDHTLTIAGIPAHEWVWTSTILGKHIEFKDIRMINNNKLYSITFGTGLAEYPMYLPIVQKMINSIELLPSESSQ